MLGVLTVLLAAELFVAANFTSILPESLAASLRFDDQWGSNRGFAWKRLWTVYKDDLTPLQMVFGLGGDAANARLNIDDYSVKYMTLLNGDVFDSAHNEYLQHLLCGGAVGLAAWLAFLAGHIRRGLRTAPGLALAVFGYAVQAFFSISMPGVLPLVFVLAALCVKPAAPGCPGRVPMPAGPGPGRPAGNAAGGAIKESYRKMCGRGGALR